MVGPVYTVIFIKVCDSGRGWGEWKLRFYHCAAGELQIELLLLPLIIETEGGKLDDAHVIMSHLFFLCFFIILVLILGTMIIAKNAQRTHSVKLQFALHRSTHNIRS